MKRILSGVQPTGNLHLGNYLGAIRQWVALQDEYESLFMLADLHAITVPQEPAKLKAHVRETAAAYIACGIDPKKSAIFPQSSVSAHAELAWILTCSTPMGWLNRMTQFKEKTKQGILNLEDQIHWIKSFTKRLKRWNALDHQEQIQNKNIFVDKDFETLEFFIKELENDALKVSKANLGLYSYPVLMAADILVYKATHVPAGHDQKQHLELARDIAGAFNRQYSSDSSQRLSDLDNKGFFPEPEPIILKSASRIMSLRDGTQKMSKSDESDYSRINLTDDADTIAKKFRKAKSDMLEGISFDDARPEAKNLLTIYAALKDITKEQALVECGNMNFSTFKQTLADIAVDHLAPITQKMRELLAAPDYLDDVLRAGVEKASGIAGKTMSEVKELVGFLAL